MSRTVRQQKYLNKKNGTGENETVKKNPHLNKQHKSCSCKTMTKVTKDNNLGTLLRLLSSIPSPTQALENDAVRKDAVLSPGI